MIKSEIIADSLNTKKNRLTTFILEYPRYIHSEVCTHRVFSKNAASSRAIPIEKMIQQVMDNPAMPEHWGKNQSGMKANEELDDSKKSELFITSKEYIDLELDHKQSSAETIYNIYRVSPREHAKRVWMEARDSAINYVRTLSNINLHKQIANRILEPWFHIRIILSGTEFENFFALRAHPDAQPEFQKLATLMLEQYNNSNPKQLKDGEWHIPDFSKLKNF